MPTIWGRNWQLQELQLEYAKLYEATLNILGSTGTILPMGDPKHGQPNATAFTTVGEQQVTFTWSEAPASFDTALDLTDPDSFQGIVPVVSFNASDEYLSTPDITYFSRNDGSSEAMTVGVWVNVTDSASIRSMMSKWDAGETIQEWRYDINSIDQLDFVFRDDSAGVNIRRTSDAAVPMGTPTFLVGSYDGTGGTDAMGASGSVQDNVTLYVNGSIVASTASDSGSYVAMENGTSTVSIGAYNTGSTPIATFSGDIMGGPLGPFFTQTELSADAVLRLYEAGRRALGL
jgi:hypothetical protein